MHRLQYGRRTPVSRRHTKRPCHLFRETISQLSGSWRTERYGANFPSTAPFFLLLSLFRRFTLQFTTCVRQPYPSQYDTESGKSGTAAGAYLYGVPRDDRQQQQPEPRAAARPSISTEVPLALTPPPLDGGIGRGSVGGGVVSEILCPAGFMISREHPQPAAAAAAVSVVEAAAVSAASAEPAVPRGVDGDYMVPPSAYPSSPHGGGDRGGGGGSGSSDPLLTPFVHGNMSRGVQHSHALPTAAPGSVAFGGLRW